MAIDPALAGPAEERRSPAALPPEPAPPPATGPAASAPKLRETRWSAADVFVAVAVAGTGVAWFRLTRHAWFFFDDWALALRGRTAGDLFEPYNGHLSITYLAVYRALYGLTGFSHYGAFRLVGIVSLLAVPVSLYLTTRNRLGPAPAALAACCLLWFHGVSLEPGGFNHPLTLTTAVVVAWLLPRSGRRADWLLGGVLALGLCTSGGAVAAALAALVHSVLTRADRRRWTAVLGPTVLWLMWWLAQGRSSAPLAPELRVTVREGAGMVVRGLFASFEGLAGGATLVGWLLVAGFVALAAVRLRRVGLRDGASVVAWSTAAVFWWAGLVQSRGRFAAADTFRYQFVAATFFLLALVPQHPPARPRREAWSTPAVIVAAVLALVAGSMGADATRRRADSQEGYGASARRIVLVAVAEPRLVAPDARYPLVVGGLSQREIERIERYYGKPLTVPAGRLDEALVEAKAVSVRTAPVAPRRCTASDRPFEVRPPFVVRAGSRPASLTARRFGDHDVALGDVPARSQATITFTPIPGGRRWTVLARGACRPGP